MIPEPIRIHNYRDTGPNFMPTGQLDDGRRVEGSYAFAPFLSWRFRDERGWAVLSSWFQCMDKPGGMYGRPCGCQLP